MGLLRLPAGALRFRGMVGTGGIGHGSFFQLEGDETLGREESRAGHLLDRRDYCKLHIISHYVKVLLGDDFAVFPIGRIGDDTDGDRLRGEMVSAGLDTRFVKTVDGSPTLFSFCFVYPDGSGGNMTTRDSASDSVDEQAILDAEPLLAELDGNGIALAVPEVPLDARRVLLDRASRFGLFRAASFTRMEMVEARASGMFGQIDLCALNVEEAAAAAGIRAEGEPAVIARRAAEGLARMFPRLLLSITAGKTGSWSWDGSELAFDPSVPVQVEGTSGAGDAHFAGILSGLAAGLPLREAQELATIVAAASVTSPHTIHPAISAVLLRSVCALRARTSARVISLLDIPIDGS